MKKILFCALLAVSAVAVFTSCKKHESVKPAESVRNQGPVIAPPPPPVVSFSALNTTLLSSGWVSIWVPAGYVPVFSGYMTIHCYTKGGDMLYAYQYLNTIGANAAQNDCHNKWNDPVPDGNGGTVNEGCYNSGKDCNVVMDGTTKKIVVICC